MQFLVNCLATSKLFEIVKELSKNHVVHMVSNDKDLIKYGIRLHDKYIYNKGLIVLTDSYFKHISTYLGFRVFYFIDDVVINQTVISYSDKLIINNVEVLPKLIGYEMPILIMKDDVLKDGFNFDITKNKKIIIPSFDLDGGKMTVLPSKYGKEFKVVELKNMVDIFGYFSKTKFSHAYSFLFDIDLSINEFNEIDNYLKLLGDKKYDIHFCTDYTKDLNIGFAKHLSIIPIQEGLKQVGYYR